MNFFAEIKYVLARRELFAKDKREEAVRSALHDLSLPSSELYGAPDYLEDAMHLAIDRYVKILQDQIDADLTGRQKRGK